MSLEQIKYELNQRLTSVPDAGLQVTNIDYDWRSGNITANLSRNLTPEEIKSANATFRGDAKATRNSFVFNVGKNATVPYSQPQEAPKQVKGHHFDYNYPDPDKVKKEKGYPSHNMKSKMGGVEYEGLGKGKYWPDWDNQEDVYYFDDVVLPVEKVARNWASVNVPSGGANTHYYVDGGVEPFGCNPIGVGIALILVTFIVLAVSSIFM